MTPLRQRMIEDMQLRNFNPATQRGYLHHVTAFARYFGRSPEVLDLEAIRQYQLYLLNERKLSPESINQCISALKFLYLNTLEMPWPDSFFPASAAPTNCRSYSVTRRCWHSLTTCPALSTAPL